MREITLGKVGLAQILARLHVVGLDSERLRIERESAIHVAELTRREARDAEQTRIVGVLGLAEKRQRLAVMAIARQPVGKIEDLVVGKRPVVRLASRLVLVRVLRAV